MSQTTKFFNSAFKEAEIEYLEEFCNIMKPLALVALALDNLQNEKNCYYSVLTLINFQNKLIGLQETN